MPHLEITSSSQRKSQQQQQFPIGSMSPERIGVEAANLLFDTTKHASHLCNHSKVEKSLHENYFNYYYHILYTGWENGVTGQFEHYIGEGYRSSNHPILNKGWDKYVIIGTDVEQKAPGLVQRAPPLLGTPPLLLRAVGPPRPATPRSCTKTRWSFHNLKKSRN